MKPLLLLLLISLTATTATAQQARDYTCLLYTSDAADDRT